MRTVLFGAEAHTLSDEVRKYPEFTLVETDPELVICYGGDGTFLAAEMRWPGVPKVPIKNSRRGNRCLPHPAKGVLKRLIDGSLARTEYMKLECAVHRGAEGDPLRVVTAMNEVNVDKGHINSAVRFKLWIDDEPYNDGVEIIGDGLLISTPFGSTAYFNHITRGVFYAGMGVAFKAPAEQTSHVVVPEVALVRVLITRGPAVLAFDNSTEYTHLEEGDTLLVRRHPQPAILYTWQTMSHPSDEF